MEKRGVSKHGRPPSVKVIIGYVIFLLAFYAFHLIYDLSGSAATVFFGRILTGGAATFVDALLVALLAFLLYGLLKKTDWSWPLAIAWFVISIANALLSLFFVQAGLLFVVRELLIIAFASAILVDGFVLWYLFRRKNYFTHHPAVLDATDKFFIYVLISFWVIVILLGLTFGIRYYKETKAKSAVIISELDGKDYNSSISTCESKAGFDKDICYTAVALIFPDKPKDEICSKTETDFFREVCLKTT